MRAMPNIEHIRNVSIISHVDHGKTTLSDHLLGMAGRLPKQLLGEVRALDELKEEQKRGITIESSIASLNIELEDGIQIHLNLIDTPGHVDFSGKVAEALRLVDGSIVLVDAVEGVMAQTMTVLRQAMAEYIQPILVINKVDRLISELELDEQSIQIRIQEIIAQVHRICKNLSFPGLILPNFNSGSVLLISALDGWGIDRYSIEHTGLTMKDIINAYTQGKVDDLREQLPLGKIVSEAIYRCLPDPATAQKIRFPGLLQGEIPDRLVNLIHECSPANQVVAMNGKLLKIGRSSGFGSLIRMLSGKITRGSRLYSTNTGEAVKVTRVVKLDLRKVQEVKELSAGDVGAVVFSPPLAAGDFLVGEKIEGLSLKNISYVQEPIVAISIEPKNIKDLNRLPDILRELAAATPGLEFEFDNDTGELIALGVGMLQLEILRIDLEDMGIQVETSPPMVLLFEMPRYEAHFDHPYWEGIHIDAGPSDQIHVEPLDTVLYTDGNGNKLVLGKNYTFSSDTIEGMIQTFKSAMRVSPRTREKVRNFGLKVSEGVHSKAVKTYENGIVLTSSAIRAGLEQSGAIVHEPFYHVTINVPDEYLGDMIQELQKRDATIKDIGNVGGISSIKAVVHVKQMADAADRFRHLTDGNVFWSYDAVEFLPRR
ncbi:MAG: GTP-binding protein [Methanobacteriota archaeon]|nr:MAG: GTP-binding protein [Euryarchaeota archaeon]